MYRKIRIAVASLLTMLVCILSSATTLSYFADTKITTNTLTVGNLSTSLSIYNHESGDNEHVFDAEDYALSSNLDIPFYPQATNDGNVPVYQRFRIVVPIDLANIVTLTLPDCVVSTASESSCSNANYTIVYKPSVNVGDIPTYAEYYITSNQVLTANSSTVAWPMSNIHIDDITGKEALFVCASNNNCVLGINAYSDTIQTTGFTDAADAFANLEETY